MLSSNALFLNQGLDTSDLMSLKKMYFPVDKAQLPKSFGSLGLMNLDEENGDVDIDLRDYEENGWIYLVSPGQNVNVTFKDISTTGYIWINRFENCPQGFIKSVQRQAAPQAAISMAGAPKIVKDVMTIDGSFNGEGSCTIVYELKRPWEHQPIETKAFHLELRSY